MLKVKTKSMFHIYIAPLVDWYQVKRHRVSQFGGEVVPIKKSMPVRDFILLVCMCSIPQIDEA